MSNYSKMFLFCTLIFTVFIKAEFAQGQSGYITYQGHLVDSGGLNITEALPIEVRLYDSLMGGLGFGLENSHLIYAEKHTAVDLKDGNFRLRIGEGQPLLAKWTGLPIEVLKKTSNVYLELWVDGEMLSPRQRVGVVPAVVSADVVKYADEIINLPPIEPNMIPTYDASKITSGVFGTGQIPQLDASRITGTLAQSSIPNLDVSKFSTSGTIPRERMKELDAGRIKNGEIPVSRLPNTMIQRANIGIRMGSLSNEQQLELPDGFDASQCQYFLSLAQTIGSVEGIDQFHATLNGSRVLNCYGAQSAKISDPKATIFCTASYLAICRK